MNPFKSELFSTTSLTWAVNGMPEVPTQVSSLGIAYDNGIETTTAWVERKEQGLRLVPSRPLGATGQQYGAVNREGIEIGCINLPQETTIWASEIQDRIKFGSSAQQLESLKDLRDERLMKMSADADTTAEYHLVGLISGKVLDADGTTVLWDFFDKFKFDEPDPIEFDFTSGAALGALTQSCDTVIRAMRAALNTNVIEIRGLAGSTFATRFKASSEYRSTFQATDAARLRDRSAYQPWSFGGIEFEEYVSPTDLTPFIAPNDCRFFARGLAINKQQGLLKPFHRRWTPAPTFAAANKPGLERYVNVTIDPRSDPQWIKIEMTSHPILFCTHPRHLIRGVAKLV
ncbi:putative Major capsid protein [uncultured Gammaproteobacteria bacterium]